MRVVEIEGRKFEVRGLLRGEVRALRADGINLMDLSPALAEEAIDAVFDIVFDREQILEIDGLENRHAMELWRAVLKETYGAEDEEKN